MRKMCGLIIVLLLVSCSQIPAATQINASALQDLDLEAIMLQDGDLPEDFKRQAVQQESEGAPFDELPTPIRALTLLIKGTNQDSSNMATILLYADQAQAQSAFESLAASSFKFDDTSQPVDGLGEAARFQREELAFHYVPFEKVAFLRCQALVYLETSADTLHYAQRLDARLAEQLCQ